MSRREARSNLARRAHDARRVLLRFVAALYRAYWALDRDISADDVLVDVATSVGLDGAALVAATADERIKQRLREATEQAERAGVCGAPCFRVGELLFWGQDRLLFVEKALDGWCPKEP